MSSYTHKWRIAVALKQPYPLPETGEVSQAPLMAALETTKRRADRNDAMTGGFGLAAALALVSWIVNSMGKAS